MSQSKHTLLLAAKDGYSRPLGSAEKMTLKLKSAVADTDKELQKLGKQQRTINQVNTLSKEVDSARLSLAASKKEVKRLSSSYDALSLNVDKHKEKLGQAKARVKTLSETYGKHSKEVLFAKNQVKGLTAQKETLEAALKAEKLSLQGAKKEAEKLTNSFTKQSQKLGGLRKELKDAGFNLKTLGAEEKLLKRHTEEATRALDKQAASLKKVGDIQSRMESRRAQRSDLIGQGLSLGVKAIPFVAAARKSISAESDFADVRKVTGLKGAEAEVFKKDMMKLAGELGGENAQQSVAQIVTAAGQSGIEKDQLLEFAEAATKMSVAWDTSAQEAGETMATWRAGMGLSQEQALDLADATNHLSNSMAAKAKDLAAVVVREGSTALGAGFSAPEVAALSASLLAGGASEERAGTALKNITGRLTTGFAATGAQKESFSRLGFDAEELAASMQENAQGTLVDVLRSIGEEDAKDQGAIISQIFGEEVKGAVSKLVQTLDDKNGLIAAFDKVADKTKRVNSVNDEYANRADTTGHRISRLSAKFERMMIVVGDRMLPVIDAVIPPLITVVDGISNFAEQSPILASGLLGIGGALLAAKAGIIAFNLARLALGNGADRVKLSREKLSLTTAKTDRHAKLASRSLARVNAQLDRMSRRGRGFSGAFGGEFDEVNRKAGKGRRGRRAGRGRFGGALQGLGSLVPQSGALGARSLSAVGRFGGPVVPLVTGGIGLAQAVSSGDTQEIASASGELAGGVGGAALGAAIGTAILPGIGTVIGAGIGGIAGSELGANLAESIAKWFGEDKTEQAPPKAIEKVTQAVTPKSSNVVHISPVFHLKDTDNKQAIQSMFNEAIEKMKTDIVPTTFTAIDASHTSLTDGAND
ncbi:phage tail tape measure protein [Alteromonadaceae bacterium M269]|nr:phage tail tape measure protein [Alteromonadaceae bacterium M269]